MNFCFQHQKLVYNMYNNSWDDRRCHQLEPFDGGIVFYTSINISLSNCFHFYCKMRWKNVVSFSLFILFFTLQTVIKIIILNLQKNLIWKNLFTDSPTDIVYILYNNSMHVYSYTSIFNFALTMYCELYLFFELFFITFYTRVFCIRFSYFVCLR